MAQVCILIIFVDILIPGFWWVIDLFRAIDHAFYKEQFNEHVLLATGEDFFFVLDVNWNVLQDWQIYTHSMEYWALFYTGRK